MNSTKKIIMIIVLLILFLIPTSAMAKAIETTWTDEATGIKFNLSVDEKGNVKASPVDKINWTNIVDYRKYREALTRAQVQAKIISEQDSTSGDSTTNKEEKQQEERKSTTTTEGKKETPNKTVNMTGNIDNSMLGWGGPLKCLERFNENIPYAQAKNIINIANVGKKNINDIKNGIDAGGGDVPKNEPVEFSPTQQSQGMVLNDAKYTVERKETVGITWESAAVAYISSRVNDANDNGNRIDNYMQIATWEDDYFKLNGEATGKFSGWLLEEAKAYQAFRKEVENWERKNKNIIKDNIVDKTVSTDIKNGKHKLRTIYIRIC